MKKCFPADESTIGGRVRKARLASGYTIKDFAALIDVSPNHLGLVERGEKNASYKLLKKIAEITETPYQQIIKGTPQKDTDVPVLADTTEKINLRLFLGLILVMSPSFNKENLASLLNTSSDTINSILNGEDVEWGPQWSAQFPILAGLLGDITTIRSDLQNLDQFLADVEFDRGMNILKENLIQYIYSEREMRYKLRQPISHKLRHYRFIRTNHSKREFEVLCTTIVLYNVDNPQVNWQFQLLQPLQPQDVLDDFDEEDMEQIYVPARELAESMGAEDRLTLLFISKDNYSAFYNAAYEEIDRISIHEAALAEIGEYISPEAYDVYETLSEALIDRETWKVADWTEFSSFIGE